MVKRQNNQLPGNLPQLQTLIKRDPESYKEEFIQQKRHYESLLSVFHLQASVYNKSLDELCMFMAQVAQCYPDLVSSFPQQVTSILETHSTILHPDMRMALCRALILLRNKDLLQPTDLLALFFQLLRSQDKALRTFLQNHIVTDIKNVNAKHKNVKLNTTLQNFMYGMLNDSNSKAAKMSLDIMVELYKKNVWNDLKTVNVIASGCFSKITKVMVGALKFFLSADDPDKGSGDSDSDDDEPSVKEVMMANKVNKKTRKRDKQLKKVKQLVQKDRKRKQKVPIFSFSALLLLHDPHGMAEKLLQQIEKTHERFEVKIMTLDVISRLIGLHQLILLNFYPYIQRFLQPHQKQVTKLLQFVAQASHEHVPPDVLEPMLRTIVNNFITERNSSDAMAIGLNAVREMCCRCPFAMNKDLLRDLVQYKRHRDRSVMMAAKSLIYLYRKSIPEMLLRKDRGRPTQESIEIKGKQFGEIDAKDFIAGAEILEEVSKEEENKVEQCEEDDSDGSWVDVDHSSDEEITDSDEEDEDGSEEDEEKTDNEGYEGSEGKDKKSKAKDAKVKNASDRAKPTGKARRKMLKAIRKKKEKPTRLTNDEIIGELSEKAAKVSVTRILTDDDFKKIDAAVAMKKVSGVKRGVKRSLEVEPKRTELVSLGDIENIHKKRKHNKEERIQSIRKGQEGREKFGYKDGRLNPFSSKTNREKRKTKNYMMLWHKARSKVKKSFKDKQISLRNHLLKQKKMK